MTLADLLLNSSLFPNPEFQEVQSPRAFPTASFSFFSLPYSPWDPITLGLSHLYYFNCSPFSRDGWSWSSGRTCWQNWGLGGKSSHHFLVLGGGNTCWFGGESCWVKRIWWWWNGTDTILNHALPSPLAARGSDEGDKSNLDTAASPKDSQPSRDVVSVVLMVLDFYRILILSVIRCGTGLQNSEAQIRSFLLSRAPFWKCPDRDTFAQFCFPCLRPTLWILPFLTSFESLISFCECFLLPWRHFINLGTTLMYAALTAEL